MQYSKPITPHWINGQAITTNNGRLADVFNPATGAVSSQVDLATVDDIDTFLNVKEIELAHFMNEVSSWDRRYLALQV